MIKPGAPDLQVIKSGKMFGVIIAVISMIVAPLLAGQDSIFGYLQKMNGLYFIPIFSVVLMGMWNRNVRAEVANSALIVGFVIIAAGYFLFPNVVDAMHEFHFLGVVFAFLVFLMLICGKVEPRDTPWEHAYSGDVDLTPWKYAKPVGFSLVATVLVLYLAFADFSILTKV
jgi:SSS family solute:Na+ symporter